MIIGQLLYDSFVFEKCNVSVSLKRKQMKTLFMHVRFWNIVLPCLNNYNSAIIQHSMNLVNQYIVDDDTLVDVVVSEDDFECLYNNRKVSAILFFLICQINFEISCTKINRERLTMLIRACHNLPRCMINGEMYVCEAQCIAYSLDNMSDDIRQVVESLINSQ